MVTENDIPLQIIRDTEQGIASEVKRRAFGAGVPIVYSKDGNVLRESSTGAIEVVRSSSAREIRIRKKIWKIG